MSPVTDPSVVAAQQSELRQFREFLSQLSPNAALFSQLLEQVLYDYRSDTDNQIGGFSLSPGPLQKGSHVHLSSLRRQAQGMQVLGCHYTTPVTDMHIPLLPPVGASQLGFIGTFGKPSLTAHIAGLPESFRQGGGGVELTRASYQAEEAKQG